MKKIGKLIINPEKVIKNEELVNLRGGYTFGTCGAKSPSGSVYCNVSKAFAISFAECDPDGTNCEGNWCCDSCGSSTYCG